IAIDPAGMVAIVSNDFSGNVSSFTIDATTGALTAAVGSPFAAGSGPISVAISPSGKYAYVASSGSVSGFSIDRATGGLSPLPAAPFTATGAPNSLVAEPSGKFVYGLSTGSNLITTYAVDGSTGNLTELSSTRTRGGDAIALSTGSTPVSYTTKYA